MSQILFHNSDFKFMSIKICAVWTTASITFRNMGTQILAWNTHGFHAKMHIKIWRVNKAKGWFYTQHFSRKHFLWLFRKIPHFQLYWCIIWIHGVFFFQNATCSRYYMAFFCHFPHEFYLKYARTNACIAFLSRTESVCSTKIEQT